jgi:hypothetical protein
LVFPFKLTGTENKSLLAGFGKWGLQTRNLFPSGAIQRRKRTLFDRGRQIKAGKKLEVLPGLSNL